MGHRYAKLMFSPAAKALQSRGRSRDTYARMEQGEDYNYLLSDKEAQFIRQRDSLYMASVSESGWPYVQHRGGPLGFIKVLNAATLGFADYRGNRQYISAGNVHSNNRVSLFLMDYPNRRRLKVAGRLEFVDPDDARLQALLDPNYRARIERGVLIHIAAFDWNCPQHITPRYTDADIERMVEQRLRELGVNPNQQ
ncbi:pyridoxamine 5'-phosphate oxidase family protein [Spongiibacter marinus]|uniref:pyridoxamine 5'-phosphate oxidase family protein n=1 Tax=Spongiibacter marinus TaxID=354246 RepID=UPI00040DC442|nr:pyridoxamine 5'-phosphate oxidase family protein [Spongiibacter marinus]